MFLEWIKLIELSNFWWIALTGWKIYFLIYILLLFMLSNIQFTMISCGVGYGTGRFSKILLNSNYVVITLKWMGLFFSLILFSCYSYFMLQVRYLFLLFWLFTKLSYRFLILLMTWHRLYSVKTLTKISHIITGALSLFLFAEAIPDRGVQKALDYRQDNY